METPKFNLTRRENDALEKGRKYDEPRKEFKEGKIKLDFEHQFSTGEVFKAKEGDMGNVDVVLERNGEVILDFQKLFRGRFIAHSFIRQQEGLGILPEGLIEKLNGRWTSLSFGDLVVFGDMRSPVEIFIMLHEMGHTFQAEEKKIQSYMGDGKDSPLLPGIYKKKFHLGFIDNQSKRERGAWAWAFRTARKVHQDYGVNFFEVFKDRTEFENIVYGSLLSNRVQTTEELTEMTDNKWDIMHWRPKRKDIEHLRILFDKERLQRAG